jgi:hypothetical protein
LSPLFTELEHCALMVERKKVKEYEITKMMLTIGWNRWSRWILGFEVL